MFSKWLDRLSSCNLFHGINRKELSNMLECLNPRVSRHKKGAYITIAWEQFTGIGIVLSGENAAGNRQCSALVSCSERWRPLRETKYGRQSLLPRGIAQRCS